MMTADILCVSLCVCVCYRRMEFQWEGQTVSRDVN